MIVVIENQLNNPSHTYPSSQLLHFADYGFQGKETRTTRRSTSHLRLFQLHLRSTFTSPYTERILLVLLIQARVPKGKYICKLSPAPAKRPAFRRVISTVSCPASASRRTVIVWRSVCASVVVSRGICTPSIVSGIRAFPAISQGIHPSCYYASANNPFLFHSQHQCRQLWAG